MLDLLDSRPRVLLRHMVTQTVLDLINSRPRVLLWHIVTQTVFDLLNGRRRVLMRHIVTQTMFDLLNGRLRVLLWHICSSTDSGHCAVAANSDTDKCLICWTAPTHPPAHWQTRACSLSWLQSSGSSTTSWVWFSPTSAMPLMPGRQGPAEICWDL